MKEQMEFMKNNMQAFGDQLLQVVMHVSQEKSTKYPEPDTYSNKVKQNICSSVWDIE